jgi:hypothetical protein
LKIFYTKPFILFLFFFRFSQVVTELIGRLAIQEYNQSNKEDFYLRQKIKTCLKNMSRNFNLVMKANETDCLYYTKLVEIIIKKIEQVGSSTAVI